MSISKKETINGIVVEHCNRWPPSVGEYGVYKDEIYYVFSHSGCGPHSVYGLENKHGKISYKPWKNTEKLSKIFSPTGYIKNI